MACYVVFFIFWSEPQNFYARFHFAQIWPQIQLQAGLYGIINSKLASYYSKQRLSSSFPSFYRDFLCNVEGEKTTSR